MSQEETTRKNAVASRLAEEAEGCGASGRFLLEPSPKQLEEMKDEFLSLVSHELRTPLTIIIGVLNTLISEGESLPAADKTELMRDALAESELLKRMVANLLQLSSVRADRLALHSEPVDVGALVRDAVKRPECFASHCFRVDIPEGIPLVLADGDKVRFVLDNIVDNAVKYSPRGSEIRVFAKLQGQDVAFGVSDEGPGIALRDQAKIFEPFERLDGFAADVIKRLGLGLPASRKLVEAQGGRIWVESAPGKGSTFWFTLPIAPTQD